MGLGQATVGVPRNEHQAASAPQRAISPSGLFPCGRFLFGYARALAFSARGLSPSALDRPSPHEFYICGRLAATTTRGDSQNRESVPPQSLNYLIRISSRLMGLRSFASSGFDEHHFSDSWSARISLCRVLAVCDRHHEDASITDAGEFVVGEISFTPSELGRVRFLQAASFGKHC
jgi:hypothetical protein